MAQLQAALGQEQHSLEPFPKRPPFQSAPGKHDPSKDVIIGFSVNLDPSIFVHSARASGYVGKIIVGVADPDDPTYDPNHGARLKELAIQCNVQLMPVAKQACSFLKSKSEGKTANDLRWKTCRCVAAARRMSCGVIRRLTPDRLTASRNIRRRWSSSRW